MSRRNYGLTKPSLDERWKEISVPRSSHQERKEKNAQETRARVLRRIKRGRRRLT